MILENPYFPISILLNTLHAVSYLIPPNGYYHILFFAHARIEIQTINAQAMLHS